MPDSRREPVFLPVRSAYDRWSRFYDTFDNPMVFMASQALGAGLARECSGKSVFEFGCGTGRNLAALQAAGAARLAGCDFSEGMTAVARGRGLENALIFHHDISQPLPPEAPSAFDAVLFSLTLEHIEAPAAPLAEARKILGSGGRVHVLEIHPYFSFGGGAAHFEDGGELVTMPAYPHQFADYLNAFSAARLRTARCTEWRPRDLGEVPAPLKALKRGPDFPMLVEFVLEAMP